MDVKLDFCRFCFKNSTNLLQITWDLYDQIENCFCIQISNKYFAKNLCQDCFEIIITSFNFKNRLKDSEDKLISILSENKKISVNLIDKVKPDFENIKVEIDVNAYNEVDYSGIENETNDLKSTPEDVAMDKEYNYCSVDVQINENVFSEFEFNDPLNIKEKKPLGENFVFKNGIYECQLCKRQFKGEKYVEKHIKLEHDEDETSKNIYKCKLCGCLYKLMKHLIVHLKRYHKLQDLSHQHSDEINQTNDGDDNKFNETNDDKLLDETRVKIEEGSGGGDKINEIDEKYYEIVEKYNNMKIHCIECGAQFAKRRLLLQHWIRHDKTKKCELCDKIFNEKLLNVHMLNVHNQHRFCELCNKDVKQYDYHVEKVHSRKKLKKCKICQKLFVNLSVLNAHTKMVHNLTFCHICGKKMTAAALKRHLEAIHMEEKNEKCEKCEKSFSTIDLLNEHTKMVHNAQYKFNCDKCEKVFKSKYKLNYHKQKVHDNYRPYKCLVCSKAFFEKKSLDEHNNTHTGVRPYVCKVCGDDFGFKSALYTHNKLKHLKKSGSQC